MDSRHHIVDKILHTIKNRSTDSKAVSTSLKCSIMESASVSVVRSLMNALKNSSGHYKWTTESYLLVRAVYGCGVTQDCKTDENNNLSERIYQEDYTYESDFTVRTSDTYTVRTRLADTYYDISQPDMKIVRLEAPTSVQIIQVISFTEDIVLPDNTNIKIRINVAKKSALAKTKAECTGSPCTYERAVEIVDPSLRDFEADNCLLIIRRILNTCISLTGCYYLTQGNTYETHESKIV